ncbi:MAG TPA: hypothetical protein PLV08_10100 [Flavobacteriales bacterium]|jgi:hypothetical protein|nr:hypothetical protein [Flavobacteriales bacterium]MBK7103526.1 hypothetical protein [Flavobacteriales bacterium]MBK7112414.1 hypothetical protein [Flavobacteriales bacterium]MBK7481583.1 hypothetical protein [Flavobacteriales bacterium]MBK7620340.1 hypothetical protein [Flavobacteriales bacterium]
MMERVALFIALTMLIGCGGCNETKRSELAYLWGEQGKYPKRDSILASQPLQQRLQAVLGGRYETYMTNWDAEGPLTPKEQTLFAEGCVSHFCDEYGSAFYVDLAKDELMALMRIKYKVEVFREGEGSIDALPEDVREWVRDNEVMQGDTDPEPPAEESTGAFDWKVWEDAPDDWKNGLKKIKANKKMTVYDQAEQAANMPCNVRLARCDLNGDGQLGTIVTYSCGFWCGQLGCAFNVYEGGRRISLVDVIDEVRPGKGGVISSKGVLLKLKKY